MRLNGRQHRKADGIESLFGSFNPRGDNEDYRRVLMYRAAAERGEDIPYDNCHNEQELKKFEIDNAISNEELAEIEASLNDDEDEEEQ